MADAQFKRHIAFKLRIGDILMGKPVLDGERFSFLELGSRRIVRVNVVGNLVEKYESERERKFLAFTLDDGSGQIKMRAFSEDVEKFRNFTQGETVLVLGVLRYWNNETYISPEIIRQSEPKYLLLRRLEIDKDRSKSIGAPSKEQIVAVKDKILGAIKNAEENGGLDIDKIILNLNDISPEIINQEIHKFIEEGIIFEPRPGKVRYLG